MSNQGPASTTTNPDANAPEQQAQPIVPGFKGQRLRSSASIERIIKAEQKKDKDPDLVILENVRKAKK